MDGKDVVRAIFEVVSTGNFDRVPELIHPDYVDFGAMGEMHGQQGFVDLITGWRAAFPDVQVEPVDIVEEGDMAAWRVVGSGTHLGELMGIAPTGRRVTLSGIDIGRRAPDGRALEHRSSPDMFGMLVQLGVIELPQPART
jgi:predicted ester cyclase